MSIFSPLPYRERVVGQPRVARLDLLEDGGPVGVVVVDQQVGLLVHHEKVPGERFRGGHQSTGAQGNDFDHIFGAQKKCPYLIPNKNIGSV